MHILLFLDSWLCPALAQAIFFDTGKGSVTQDSMFPMCSGTLCLCYVTNQVSLFAMYTGYEFTFSVAKMRVVYMEASCNCSHVFSRIESTCPSL